MRNPFAPYGRIFAVPGARSFSFAGWLARVPMSSMGLGSVLMVAGETGSYGLAGAVAGTLALAFAVGSPQWARGMDRLGQGRVLAWSAAVYLVLGVSFAAAVVLGAPRWSWFVLAALAGASAANVGAAVRARWAHALPGADERQTAFAFESVVDEVVFVVGPPTITFLAALIAPPAGFLVGLLVGVLGSVWLSRQTATQPPVHRRAEGTARSATSVLSPTLLVVAVAYLAVGVVFGAMDVVVVGFAQEQGQPVMAGVALAAYAGGSLVSGLLYGIVRLPGTLLARFVGCGLLFGLATQSLLLVGSLPWLVVAVFLAGLTIAPVLVAGMSLVESRVERTSLNEGLTWTSTGLTLGVTAGAAVAGAAVDAWGAEGAFLVPAAGAALAGLLALAGGLLVRRPDRLPRDPGPAPTTRLDEVAPTP
ncbi:Predicted arabinose efflux permease, MFS family [Klenkia marina]|uniref:Predicted arabinose efflux permease, MFS family n=1 Tax=Klenkia marina TaxID=1960309 RepID=A0A1G4XQU3_9ACTN|nr:MFS transporter [Klenkia marina]SCX43485.1 Predicted arabinose efflux permease, MFS family [Klenkia marina]